jgi:F-type H+-transporting ATPase subunit b
MEALGINAGNLLVNIVCFGIAWLIIARLIVNPIRKMIDNRKAVIDQGLEDAKVAADTRENALNEAETILSDAKAKSAQILKEAADQAAQLKQDYQTSVDEKVNEELRNTKDYLAKERELMLNNLRSQIIDLSISGAKKIIGEDLQLDQEKQRRLLSDFFTGIKDGTITSVDQLPDNLAAIEVTTAIPLLRDEKVLTDAQLIGKLQAGGRIDYQVDPKILGGMIIHSGDYLIDASVLGKAQDLKAALHK